MLYERRLTPPPASNYLICLTILATLFATLQDGEDRSFEAGFVYWLIHVGVGLAVLHGVDRLLSGGRGERAPAEVLLTGLLGALVFSPLALVFDVCFATAGAEAELQAGVPLALLDEFTNLTPPFVATWLLLHAAAWPSRGTDADAAGIEDSEPAVAQTAGLLSRLPSELGTEVRWLRAEGNYLEVATARGRTLVLYALARAEAEMGERGLRVHRSWWVAGDAVSRVARGGRGLVMELVDGTRVPISRRRQAAVRTRFGEDLRPPSQPP